MVGIAGGTLPDDALSETLATLDCEPWYETDRVAAGGNRLGIVHHGETDPRGHTTWSGDGGAGVMYGVAANRRRLGLSTDDLFEGLLHRPENLLPELDGPFVVALVRDDGTVLAATDKLGSRSCYYAETPDGLVLGSELKAPLGRLEDVTLDGRATGDLLTFGWVMGDRTLAAEASALQPASLLRYEDGDLSVERYWRPPFGRAPAEGYVDRTVELYQEAIGDLAGTLDGRVGLWLSGGLDSRTMAAVLRETHGPFTSLTYDGNPRDGSNVGPAREVSERLGLDHREVEFTPTHWGSLVERAVDLTDGMASWAYYLNPDFVFDRLRGQADVLLEGAPQGELLGEGLWAWDLDNSASVAEAMLRRHTVVDPGLAADLFEGPVAPARSVREEAAKSDESSIQHRILDVWWRNFASNAHFRTNKLSRSQVGMRLPFANTALLSHLAKMPYERFRRDAVPFTRGKIPRSMAPLKREVLGKLNSGLDEIPYERTRVTPARPMWMNDAAYLAKQAWWSTVAGRPTEVAEWSRDDRRVREPITRWLDRAAARPEFDADTVDRVLDEHLSGDANHVQPIAAVTTVEQFLETHVD